MTAGLQPSLLSFHSADASTDETVFADLGQSERTVLAGGAWIDVHRGWMRNGFDLFDDLLASNGWKAERRQMYDNIVDVPRLLRFFPTGHCVPWPSMVLARTILSAHYRTEIGEDLTSTGLCLYRDGNDSVAWHGDTIGRGATVDTVVAILSLGSSRSFGLRTRTRGESPGIRLTLDHGDLIVMGGSCQRTWEHSVPKTSRSVGPRISIQFRAAGVS